MRSLSKFREFEELKSTPAPTSINPPDPPCTRTPHPHDQPAAASPAAHSWPISDSASRDWPWAPCWPTMAGGKLPSLQRPTIRAQRRGLNPSFGSSCPVATATSKPSIPSRHSTPTPEKRSTPRHSITLCFLRCKSSVFAPCRPRKSTSATSTPPSFRCKSAGTNMAKAASK